MLPKVKAKHHKVMTWRDVPVFYAYLKVDDVISAKMLRLTCLTGLRTTEILGMRLDEIDIDARLWTCPAEQMKTGEDHRVPLTDEMLSIIEALEVMQSDFVFEGAAVRGFRSTFRDLASEIANAPRDVAEMSPSHRVGSVVDRAYARFGQLAKRRVLIERWLHYVFGSKMKR
ncbi:MAG: integrase [Candidatus Azotimanducaceae bacterium]